MSIVSIQVFLSTLILLQNPEVEFVQLACVDFDILTEIFSQILRDTLEVCLKFCNILHDIKRDNALQLLSFWA